MSFNISLTAILNELFIINIFLAILLVFFERRNPRNTLTWLMVLLFIPIAGFILYLFLGQDLRKRKLFNLKSEDEAKIIRDNYRQQALLETDSCQFNDPRCHQYTDMIRLHLLSSSSIFTQDNYVEIYNEGHAKFAALLESLNNAKNFILMEYYIIRNDSLGKKVVQILTAKAKEGVEVRLLYDGMGCIRLPQKFFQPLLEAGGQTAVFFPPFIPYINFRLNYRNHRKICVIDGEEAFLGGFNIGNEYLGLSKKFGFWRDLHLKIKGSAVNSLTLRFLLDWRFASKEDVSFEKFFAPKKSCPQGGKAIQIVSSGPDSKWRSIKTGYLKIIASARKHIYIETPYFIPDESIFNALVIASLSGVDVRIIIPNKPDHLFVYWASLSYCGELLEAGIRFFTYKKGFIHSKMITADGFVSSVGTANLDIRSFKINFEVNSFLYSSEIAQQLEEIFMQDMLDSTEITLERYRKRSMLVKTKESVSRLLSPLL
ncbi:cardiolipin synthase [Bacillota bacterium LX-D]|nr:cardiolipin synthase [Bacillota bacterium LX-D]